MRDILKNHFFRIDYISVWPKGIPAEEFDGGWKTVYASIIDSYVSRGYPVDPQK